MKEEIVSVIFNAKSKGIPKFKICAVLQINARRVERWVTRKRDTGNMENHTPGPKHPVNAIMPCEKQTVLDYVRLEETVDYSLRVLACKGAGQGLFLVSATKVSVIFFLKRIYYQTDGRPSDVQVQGKTRQLPGCG